MTAPHRSASEQSFLLVGALDRNFALPISHVRRVARIAAMTSAPLAPPHILGLANIDGEIVAVHCLARCLDPSARPRDFDRFVVVLDVGGEAVGLAVSSLGDVEIASERDVSLFSREIDFENARSAVGVLRTSSGPALILHPAKLLNFYPPSLAA